jgi:hypothetical protein
VSYDYEYRYMRELARSFVEVIMSNADRLFRGETV